MRVAVTGATGFIGRALVNALNARGDAVVALTRAPDRARFDPGIRVARFDPAKTPDAPADSAAINPFEDVDAVIHLAGETVAGRWNAAKKQEIDESRVSGTRNLVTTLSACARKPRILISASASGYYGNRADEPLLESSASGDDFLSGVCVAWEREAARAESLGMRVAMLRQGLVLGQGGGALAPMLPPFRAFAGGPLGNGSQWWPWIHLDDDVALFLFTLDRELHGPVNAVSPDIATNARFSQALGAALRRPSLAFAPAFALRIVLGEFADSVLASQLMLPEQALAAGFTFAHANLEQALLDILAPNSGRRPATQHLTDSYVVPTSIERAFAYLSNANNLVHLTPPEFKFRVLTPGPIDMRRGATIDHALKISGMQVRWRSLVTEWRPNTNFVDYQVRGPFVLWRHEHRFSPVAQGTLIEDRVDYSLPLAPLSSITLPLARSNLERLFAYRRSVLPRLLDAA